MCLNLVLSRCISPEQFGFLENKHILEAIEASQKVFHNIKKRKKTIIFQSNLNKAYDRVHWGFLRLVLIQIGIPYRAMKWIIACVLPVNYVIFMNGSLQIYSQLQGVYVKGSHCPPFFSYLSLKVSFLF